jgi:excisionase family DNA binding protein
MNSSHPVETSVATITSAPVLIKKKELAKRLSVSTRTIDDWTRKRKIPYLQLGNRFFLYDAAAVLDTLRKQYQIDSVK